MAPAVRRSRLLVVVVVALLLAGLVALVPALRANAAARQQAWEAGCVAGGGSVGTAPPPQRNPLVVQSGHTVYQCRSATGALVSTRD